MMNFRKILFCISFLSIAEVSISQTPAEFEANYAKRIRQEMISGVYIPFDLNDAFSELNRLSDAKGIASFKKAPDSLIAKNHFGLIQWVQLNWGLDEGSRISHYLKSKGISIPDDMAKVIVLTYHRHLNNKPLLLEQEAALIAKRMQEQKMRRDSASVRIIIDKKPHKE